MSSSARSIAVSRARAAPSTRGSLKVRVLNDVRRNRIVYLMLAPVLAYYVIFHYGPMYGEIIALKV